MLPTAEGSDKLNHVTLIQRSTLNAGEHFLLNPSVERTKENDEG